MATSGGKVLVIAARQPEFAALLEEDGFDVELRTRPLDDAEDPSADVVVVFRGRLIGRGQASAFAARGIPVVEVLTVEPPGTSSAGWIRLSNRIGKSDLAQVVHAAADWARSRCREPALGLSDG
ncbi:MAG: hypothetical protein ICV74_01190 [Thermoleophilia bacterium]|nr:hypothetical protein [Thermoleophilia bacterium]